LSYAAAAVSLLVCCCCGWRLIAVAAAVLLVSRLPVFVLLSLLRRAAFNIFITDY
jgi:hypothetical protein